MSISNESRGRIKKVFEPIALGMGRLGLTPDGLTLIGFGITAVGAALLAGQLWLAGGLVVFLGGVFDMFDGTLARATGKVSRLGAFMDSVFDRWGEAIVYIGIIAGAAIAEHTRVPILAGAAMGGAFMVSYARAKSESLGFTPGTGMANIGLAPREVRLAILVAGLLLTSIPDTFIDPACIAAGACDIFRPAGYILGSTYLAGTLGLITILATITTIQRMLHVRAQAREG
jgi:phosphatidylglycerophosphate synthase